MAENYVLEVSIVKGNNDVNIIDNSLFTIEIPVNANINIYNEGGTPPTLYASDIYWDISTKLDTKINQIQNILNSTSGINVYKVTNATGTHNLNFTNDTMVWGIYFKYISGNPVLNVSVNSINYLNNYSFTNGNFDLNLNQLTTNININISGGNVNLYVVYKEF